MGTYSSGRGLNLQPVRDRRARVRTDRRATGQISTHLPWVPTLGQVAIFGAQYSSVRYLWYSTVSVRYGSSQGDPLVTFTYLSCVV